MDIFDVISLCGGLAFFLYGMHVLSSGLEKMTGGKLEAGLKKLTSSPVKSMLLGAGITAAIQSSSAVTVMLVGLVNSGIMQLEQTVGVIMGSNIGTTITAWIFSLAGIESDNVIVNLIKPENFAPIIALLGIIFIMTKSTKRKHTGSVLVGFAVLMYGMTLMKDSVAPLKDSPVFAEVILMFNNPIFGILVGLVITGIIQGSAATVGILQALSATGQITFGMAIPIIMGSNIGTCVTALISTIGANKSAKRVSIVHIAFNVLGTVICLPVFYILHGIFHFDFVDGPVAEMGIAVVHTVFNVATTLVLMPFRKALVKIANFIIKDKEGTEEEYSLVDSLLEQTPAVAVAECNRRVNEMASIAKRTISTALELLNGYSEELCEAVLANEDALDNYEDRIGTMLVKLSRRSLSVKDSRSISKQLHSINDFERIGDHAVNIMYVSDEMFKKKITFSKEAAEDIALLSKALSEILDLTVEAYENEDITLAAKIEPVEQIIDDLISTTKNAHIDRLKAGQCTIELGFVLADLLTAIERVSDHCSNIGATIIETAQDSFDTHRYLQNVKNGDDGIFQQEYARLKEKYGL